MSDTYIERRYEQKTKISHTTANGDIVTVGDLVINWAEKVGVVVKIQKEFGRWRVLVHMLEESGNYTPSYYASSYGTRHGWGDVSLYPYNPDTIAINENEDK